MILYFSGTGNSQFVALRLAEMLAEDEVVSINRHLKSGEKAAIRSDRPLMFVVPTYAWRMPTVVSDWIAASHFTGNRRYYIAH